MGFKNKITKMKAPGAAVVAAAIAVAFASPGGAFTVTPEDLPPFTDGRAFADFAEAFAGDLVEQATSGGDPVQIRSQAEGFAAAVVQKAQQEVASQVGQLVPDPADLPVNNSTPPQVNEAIDQLENLDLPPVPTPDVDDNVSDVDTQQLEEASVEEVIAALLGLVDSVEPEVFAAIDTAEALILAKIDDARAQAVAAFAQANMPELQAMILAQIDAARVLVQQAFDALRAEVQAAFDLAREHILGLEDVDLPDELDDILAEIAALEDLVQTKIGEIQDLLTNLGNL